MLLHGGQGSISLEYQTYIDVRSSLKLQFGQDFESGDLIAEFRSSGSLNHPTPVPNSPTPHYLGKMFGATCAFFRHWDQMQTLNFHNVSNIASTNKAKLT